VIEAEVPNTSVHHAEAGKGENCANDPTRTDIVPVMELIDCESTADECGTENWSVGRDELPERWVVV